MLDEERAGAARAAQKAAAEALAYREEGQGRQSGEPEGGATTARFVLRPTKRGK